MPKSKKTQSKIQSQRLLPAHTSGAAQAKLEASGAKAKRFKESQAFKAGILTTKKAAKSASSIKQKV